MKQDIDLAISLGTKGFAIYGGAAGMQLGWSAYGGCKFLSQNDYIVTSAPGDKNDWAFNSGSVFYLNTDDLSDKSTLFLRSSRNGQYSIQGYYSSSAVGQSLSCGDINGDGFDDLIVSAPSDYFGNHLGYGGAWIAFGGAYSWPRSFKYFLYGIGLGSVSGANVGDYIGQSVSAAGDFNGDGYNDILLGAAHVSHYGSKVGCGATYIVLGTGPGGGMGGNIEILLPSRYGQGLEIIGSAAGDQSGFSVSSADINNDGFSDVIIGAPGASPYDRLAAGITYIIWGGRSIVLSDAILDNAKTIDLWTLSSDEGLSIIGSAAGDNSGYSVSAAGDVNNDGYDDLIIGAPYSSPNNRSAAGTSYIVFGKSSGFPNIDLANFSSSDGFAIIGSAAGDNSGYSVSTAGDVNNDGYDDFIIGAPYSSPNERSAAGTSYIVFGKSSNFYTIDLANLSSAEGLKIIGANAGEKLGISVSRAGDINNDGYADIIIGAPYASANGLSNAGASYVIYGNESYAAQTPSPTISPSAVPTIQPTFIPTVKPTAIPTTKPTKSPSIVPTKTPTMLPTFAPTKTPTPMPTQAIYISEGGTYVGNSVDESFIIDSSANVIITGGGGFDTYVPKPHTNVEFTITDFNKNSDKINLQAFDCHDFDELNITSGSIMINLEENQKIRLLQLHPGDIDANNFIFTPTSVPTLSPAVQDNSHNSNNEILSAGVIVGIVVGGTALLSACCTIYAAVNHIWPFVKNVDIAIDKAVFPSSGSGHELATIDGVKVVGDIGEGDCSL